MPPKIHCPEGDGYRWCPDCGRCQPVDAFSPTGTYCRVHQAARAKATKAKALANPAGPARAKKREADARYRERHKLQVQATINAWKRRPENRPKVQAWYRDWAERNQEKRRAAQARYRQKRSLRSPRPSPPSLPPDVARELDAHERETRRDD